MTFVLKNVNNWDQVGRNFGEGLGEGYTQGSDERAIRKAIDGLPANASYRDILNAVSGVNTYDPRTKQQAVSNWMKSHEFDLEEKKTDIAERRQQYLDDERIRKDRERAAKDQERQDKKQREITEKAEKESRERNEADEILDQLDIAPERKSALKGSISKSAAEDLLKSQIKEAGKKSGDAKLTPFEKKLQEKNAEEYIKLSNEIPKLDSTLQDIDYAKELSNKLGGTGTVTSYLGVSPTAKELEAVSFTLMEPIVKIFNPSGPIAQQKLKMIQDKYVVQPGDAPWTRKAKLDSLERFAKQARNRAQQKLDLIKQYEGNPPDSVIKKFDKESDTLSDAMIDYDLIGEEATDKELPKPQTFKGKTITAPDGRKFYSDGTRWTKK